MALTRTSSFARRPASSADSRRSKRRGTFGASFGSDNSCQDQLVLAAYFPVVKTQTPAMAAAMAAFEREFGTFEGIVEEERKETVPGCAAVAAATVVAGVAAAAAAACAALCELHA